MSENAVIVGIDEAGRGALAGPVIAAACVEHSLLRELPFIQDSKKLTETSREKAYAWITQYCTYGVGVRDASFIDTHGILAATEGAMQEAVQNVAVSITPTYLLIDGRDKFWFDYPHSSIIKGDEKEPCIAAASIIAKVTRDRMMSEYEEEYRFYNFAGHKGYGSVDHFKAISQHGQCPLHRSTFIHEKTLVSQIQR